MDGGAGWDLLCSLIQKNPQNRLSAAEASSLPSLRTFMLPGGWLKEPAPLFAGACIALLRKARLISGLERGPAKGPQGRRGDWHYPQAGERAAIRPCGTLLLPELVGFEAWARGASQQATKSVTSTMGSSLDWSIDREGDSLLSESFLDDELQGEKEDKVQFRPQGSQTIAYWKQRQAQINRKLQVRKHAGLLLAAFRSPLRSCDLIWANQPSVLPPGAAPGPRPVAGERGRPDHPRCGG